MRRQRFEEGGRDVELSVVFAFLIVLQPVHPAVLGQRFRQRFGLGLGFVVLAVIVAFGEPVLA